MYPNFWVRIIFLLVANIFCKNVYGKEDTHGKEEIVSSFHTSKTNRISVNLPNQLSTGNTAMRWEIVNVEDNPHCEKDDKRFKEGEIYKKDHVIYQCERGYMYPKGCFMSTGKELKIGEKFFDYPKNSVYECYGGDMKIGYKERNCGSVTPCDEFPEDKKKDFHPTFRYQVAAKLIMMPSPNTRIARQVPKTPSSSNNFFNEANFPGNNRDGFGKANIRLNRRKRDDHKQQHEVLYNGNSDFIFPGGFTDGCGEAGPEVKQILGRKWKGGTSAPGCKPKNPKQ